MNPKKTKYNFDFLKDIKSITFIFTIIFTSVIFIYQTQGLPPRVSKLEQDLPETKEQLKKEINVLREEISKNNVKVDLILSDVKEIKVLLMRK